MPSLLAFSFSKYQKWSVNAISLRRSEEEARLAQFVTEKFIFLQQKVFIFISTRKLMRRLFETNCFVDDTVLPPAKRKYFFWISLRRKLANWIPDKGGGGPQTLSWGQTSFWGKCSPALKNVALFQNVALLSSCCGRCILRWSPSIPTPFCPEWEFDAESKDQTDKCHFHPLHKNCKWLFKAVHVSSQVLSFQHNWT